MTTNGSLNRKFRMALVGGGQGAFIGRVHATAAVLDNRAALVAGALSSDAARARASAADYDIPPARAYGSYKEMLEKEKALPGDQRIDFVSVATPNHTHFEIAKAALLPAIFYFVSLFVTADLEAARHGLKGMARADLPSVTKTLLNGWHFLVPVGVLIYFLAIAQVSPGRAAARHNGRPPSWKLVFNLLTIAR